MHTGAEFDEHVVVVGVCGAGKTTLVRGLLRLGYPARVCAQEHSYVPSLFRRCGRPRALVFLHASLPVVRRRLNVTWDEQVLVEQQARLGLAHNECDCFLNTDPLTIAQVLHATMRFLETREPYKPMLCLT